MWDWGQIDDVFGVVVNFGARVIIRGQCPISFFVLYKDFAR